MTITRTVILARGIGSRMKAGDAEGLTEEQRRAADAGVKAMMPIGGRSFLDYVLSSVADADFREVGLVIGPNHHEIRRHYDVECPPTRVRVHFFVQPQPLGTANAVLAAAAWVGDDPFVTLNADNLYPVEALRALSALDGPGLPVFEQIQLIASSNIPAARVAAFALVEIDAAGFLSHIVEKPGEATIARAGERALVSMNCWRFDRRIFEACRDVPRSARGEFELPNAVGVAIDRGVKFRAVPAQGPVLDLSARSDVAEVARRLAGVVPRP
jgi:glucose-1-phosphate thymidylyltransferase